MPGAGLLQLSDTLRQLCTEAYRSQYLHTDPEVSAQSRRRDSIRQEHEQAMHRLGVVRARLKIQHNLLDRQAGVLLTALLHADTLSACEAGVVMGLRALAQLEAAGTAMDPVDCDMAALSSSQAQVRIAQQALTSAAHVVCKLGGRMLLEQASDPVMMPSSLVQALVHGGKQRLQGIFSDLEMARMALTSVMSDLDHRIAEMINTYEGAFECLICRSDAAVQDCFLISACGHRICRPCALRSIHMDMNMQVVSVCPVCKAEPCAMCPASRAKLAASTQQHQEEKEEEEEEEEEEAGGTSAQHCMITQQDAMTLLSDADYQRFLSVTAMQAMNAGLFMRCPGQDCGQGVQMEAGEVHFACPTCSFEFCTACGVKWHEDSTCEQYQAWLKENSQGDAEFERLHKAMGSKKCPKCKHAVIKESVHQCNKISCNMCRITFCWICGQQVKDYDHFNDRASACYDKLFVGVPGH